MAEIERYYLRLRTQMSHYTPAVEYTAPPDHIEQGYDDPWCPDPDSCKEIYFYRTDNQEIAEKLIRLFETRYADHFRTSGSERFDGYFHVVPASELGEAERFLANEEIDNLQARVATRHHKWRVEQGLCIGDHVILGGEDLLDVKPPLPSDASLDPVRLYDQAERWEDRLPANEFPTTYTPASKASIEDAPEETQSPATRCNDAYGRLLRATEKHRLTFLYFALPKRVNPLNRTSRWDTLPKDSLPDTKIPTEAIDVDGEFLFEYRWVMDHFAQVAIGQFGPGQGVKAGDIADDGRWVEVEGGSYPYWCLGDNACDHMERSSDELLNACRKFTADRPDEQHAHVVDQIVKITHDGGQSKWYSSVVVSWEYLQRLDDAIRLLKLGRVGRSAPNGDIAADGSEAAETSNEERIACGSRPMAKTRIESLRAACRDLLEQLRSFQRASGETPKADWPSVSRAYRTLKIHTGVCGEEGLIRGIEPLMENAERCAESLVERRDYCRRLKRASPDQVEHKNYAYHASDLMDPEVWDEFTGQVDIYQTDYGKWWEYESGRVDKDISDLQYSLMQATDDLVVYLNAWLLPQTDKALSDEPLPAKSKPFPDFDAVQDGGSGKDPAVEPGKAGGAGESHSGMTRDLLPDVSKFAHAIRHTLVLASDAKLLDRFRHDHGDGISEFWAGVRLDEYHSEAEDEAARDDRCLAFQRLADQSGKYIIDTPYMHFDNDVPPGLWAEVHRAKSSGAFARYWVLLLHVLGWRESRATKYLCDREWLEGATMEDERYCFKSSIPDVVSATTETILLAVANQARFKLECLCPTYTRDPAEWRASFHLSDPRKELAFREDLPVREHAITASIYEVVDGLANLTTDLCQQLPSTHLTCGEDVVTYEEIVENQGGQLEETARYVWCHPDFGPQHAEDIKQKFQAIEATAQQYPDRLDRIMADYRRDANRALMIYIKEFAGNLKPLYEEIEKQGGLDSGSFEVQLPGVRREPKTIKAIAAEIRAAYTGKEHSEQYCQSSFRQEVLRFIELLVQLNNTVVQSCSQEEPGRAGNAAPLAEQEVLSRASTLVGSEGGGPADDKARSWAAEQRTLYSQARQVDLVTATNQVLGKGTLNPGVLSRVVTKKHILNNGLPKKDCRVDVASFLAWIRREKGIQEDEVTQIRNAIIGEIDKRIRREQGQRN